MNRADKPTIPTGEMRFRPEDPPGDSANAEVNFIQRRSRAMVTIGLARFSDDPHAWLYAGHPRLNVSSRRKPGPTDPRHEQLNRGSRPAPGRQFGGEAPRPRPSRPLSLS